jgi:predicted nucleic acid-binding Zn ribbon protein
MLIENVEPKSCLKCGKTIRGRVDKKFCDDYCRNVYNNHIKADSNHYVRNINHILRKNRRILESLLPENRQDIKTNKDKLFLLGFCFQYFTNTHTNYKGDTYFFCYDYGLKQLENDRYLIVRATASLTRRREVNRSEIRIEH